MDSHGVKKKFIFVVLTSLKKKKQRVPNSYRYSIHRYVVSQSYFSNEYCLKQCIEGKMREVREIDSQLEILTLTVARPSRYYSVQSLKNNYSFLLYHILFYVDMIN